MVSLGTRQLTGSAAAVARRPPRRRFWPARATGYLFIAPLVIGIALFQLYPIAVTTYASFTQWNGLSSPVFTGLDNYRRLLTDDPTFRLVIKNTLFFMLGAIPLTTLLALGLALLTSQQRRGMAFFRMAFFVPFVANTVAVSFVWYRLFGGEDGVLNGFLGGVGVHGPDWLVTSPWAMLAVIIASVWQGMGYPMIVLIGGLQSIPATIYEASAIDGATGIRKFRHITLPLVTPSLFFVILTQFITTFQVFGIVYVMTQGGPNKQTTVYLLYVFNTAFGEGQVGYASAMAWILFVIIGLVTLVQWRLQRRWVFYG